MAEPLTAAIVLALATSCAPGIDPNVLVGVARTESGFRTDAVNRNKNGTRDVGLMQINERNFGWLGLTEATALDPCQSLRAARDLFQSYSRYNTGSPTRGFDNGYVQRILTTVSMAKAETPPDEPVTKPPAGDAWDIFAPAGGTQFVFSQKGTP